VSRAKELKDLAEELSEVAPAETIEIIAGPGKPIPEWVYAHIDRREKDREARRRWRERNPEKHRQRLDRARRYQKAWRARKKAEAAVAAQAIKVPA
jgi:hypothetical protein